MLEQDFIEIYKCPSSSVSEDLDNHSDKIGTGTIASRIFYSYIVDWLQVYRLLVAKTGLETIASACWAAGWTIYAHNPNLVEIRD